VIVAAGECTGRGVGLTETDTGPVYSGCSYSAVNPGDWSAPTSTCSASASQTRTYQCRRSDGTIVAGSECTNRGVGITETSTGPNYSGCSYSASFGNWSTCTGGNQTRPVTCTRSDGVQVDAANCGFSSGQTQQSQNCATYDWEVGTYGGWSSCSNSSRFRTRTVTCMANPGGAVADSNCSASKPQTTETEGCTEVACRPATNIQILFGNTEQVIASSDGTMAIFSTGGCPSVSGRQFIRYGGQTHVLRTGEVTGSSSYLGGQRSITLGGVTYSLSLMNTVQQGSGYNQYCSARLEASHALPTCQ
jgi:hypothetical protein